jgi:hypothetical protein
VTRDELALLRALCDAATPGPWKSGRGYEQSDPGAYVSAAGGPIIACDEVAPSPADAALIAEARTALPAALDEIERLRRALGDIYNWALELEVISIVIRARGALEGTAYLP